MSYPICLQNDITEKSAFQIIVGIPTVRNESPIFSNI